MKKNKKALLVIDVQNDFCEGGSLAVPNANEIISKINDLMKSDSYDFVVNNPKKWQLASALCSKYLWF